MNYRGLKCASRQSLRDSGINYKLLTFFFLLCIYLVEIPVEVVTQILAARATEQSALRAATARSNYMLWNITSALVTNALSLIWAAGYSTFVLRLSRREPVGFRNFFGGFQLAGKLICLHLLMALYTTLWSFLFLIPGFIAAYSYRLAVFALLDDPTLSASQAIEESKRLTYGHKGELFRLDLHFFWFYGLYFIVTLPIYLYAFDLLPLSGEHAALQLSIVVNVLTLILCTFLRPYVDTTNAHAYNWLVQLDRERSRKAKNDFKKFNGFAAK